MRVGPHEFTKNKFEGVDGKIIVALTSDNSRFSLRATRGGLEISGEFILSDEVELQEFARLLSDAWVERKRLVPKLATTLSGH